MTVKDSEAEILFGRLCSAYGTRPNMGIVGHIQSAGILLAKLLLRERERTKQLEDQLKEARERAEGLSSDYGHPCDDMPWKDAE